MLIYGEHELVRRVSGVTLVTPGPSLTPLVDWEPPEDYISHATGLSTMEALAKHLGILAEDTRVGLKQREDVLQDWLARGDLSPSAAVLMAEAYRGANA